MAVKQRAGRQQNQSGAAGDRAAQPAADPPGDEQADDADGGADQAARLEQIERQNFGDQCRRHVETAAIFIQIDERQRARIGKARAVKLEQQVAILRMGVVVPAEAVIPEGDGRDEHDRHQNQDGQNIGPAIDFAAGQVFSRPHAGHQDASDIVYLVAAANRESTYSQFTR